MMADFRGVPVSARSETALAAADDFNRRLVHMDSGVGALFAAQAAEPHDPLLALCAAIIYLYGQQAAPNDRAGELLAQVASEVMDLTARDRMLLGALRSLQGKRHQAACDAFEAITEAFPADLLSAKLAEYVYYLLGQQHSGPRFRAHMQRLAPHNPGDPDHLAMLAFAHELSDDFDEAEAAGLAALGADPRTPWAEHALSHACIRRGRAEEGRARLRAFLPLLKTCDPLVFCHDVWHLALLELELGDAPAARRILEVDVWGPYPETTAQQVDAVSLAWRLEVAGVDLGTFWKPVADQAARHVEALFIPFVSAHHAYVLARAGDDAAAATLVAAARRRAEGDDREARTIWAPMGAALVEAAAASGRGDFAAVVRLLEPAAGLIALGGGSDAQTDLFRIALAHALARTGRMADARTYWRQATAYRGETDFDRAVLQAA